MRLHLHRRFLLSSFHALPPSLVDVGAAAIDLFTNGKNSQISKLDSKRGRRRGGRGEEGVGGSSWRSGGAGGTAEVAMNHTKQAVLDTCVAGLAGQQVLEQTMEHMKENWPDVRRARVALRQLDAVAKCMEKQATTMACKIGMSMALKHRKKMQCQQPAAVAQTPLRQVTNFIADSSSASSTKKRAVCKSQSRIDRDVAPSMLQFTSPRVLRPRPVLEKPRPDAGKMYTARTAVKYMHQRSQNDKKWRKCNVAAELVRDGLYYYL